MKTEEILEKIEKLRTRKATKNFIKSLDLTPEQMELLADHKNEDVRRGLAGNFNLTEEVMIKLSNDKDKWVRRGLARNTKITDKVMIKLSSDVNWHVRLYLAQNPNLTSKKAMIKLSNDNNKAVRFCLIDNSTLNLTEELIILLASDSDGDVKRVAFKKLKKLNSLKKDALENAYDLIRNLKYIGRNNFEKTFDFIINKFPELSKLAKMFKTIILKGKKDLK